MLKDIMAMTETLEAMEIGEEKRIVGIYFTRRSERIFETRSGYRNTAMQLAIDFVG